MKILLATTNKHKLVEYEKLTKGLGIEFLLLSNFNCDIESPEDFDTFWENALQKANFYHKMFSIPVIADDSGIEVFNLNNFPGVKSKRWMEDSAYDVKVEKLLELLNGRDSSCQYKAVIAYVDGNEQKWFEGTYKGKLVTPDKNNKAAFGYDIGFLDEDKQELVSNLPIEYKNEVSHRSKALKDFVEWYKNSR